MDSLTQAYAHLADENKAKAADIAAEKFNSLKKVAVIKMKNNVNPETLSTTGIGQSDSQDNYNKPFSLSVKALIQDPQKRYLLLKRGSASKNNAGKWDFPGGKVDAGEAFDQALIREVWEETGLQISLNRVVGSTQTETPERHIIYLFFDTHLQKSAVNSQTNEIVVTLSSEHDAYLWVEKPDLIRLDVVAHFQNILRRLQP